MEEAPQQTSAGRLQRGAELLLRATPVLSLLIALTALSISVRSCGREEEARALARREFEGSRRLVITGRVVTDSSPLLPSNGNGQNPSTQYLRERAVQSPTEYHNVLHRPVSGELQLSPANERFTLTDVGIYWADHGPGLAPDEHPAPPQFAVPLERAMEWAHTSVSRLADKYGCETFHATDLAIPFVINAQYIVQGERRYQAAMYLLRYDVYRDQWQDFVRFHGISYSTALSNQDPDFRGALSGYATEWTLHAENRLSDCVAAK